MMRLPTPPPLGQKRGGDATARYSEGRTRNGPYKPSRQGLHQALAAAVGPDDRDAIRDDLAFLAIIAIAPPRRRSAIGFRSPYRATAAGAQPRTAGRHRTVGRDDGVVCSADPVPEAVRRHRAACRDVGTVRRGYGCAKSNGWQIAYRAGRPPFCRTPPLVGSEVHCARAGCRGRQKCPAKQARGE